MTGFIFVAILLSAVMHASWNFLTKKAAGNYKILWLSLVVWSVLTLPVTVYLLVTGGFHRGSLIPLLVSIAAHASYFITLMSAYRTGDISTAYPIARGIGVAGTGLIGCLILRENVTVRGGAGILLVITGVLLIGISGASRPAHRKTFGLALATGAGIVSYTVADKFGVAHTHPLLYLSLLNLGSLVLTAPLALDRGGRALGEYWNIHRGRILLISLGSGFTYLLILLVMRIERASYIVAVRESSVVVAVLLGHFFLRERITPLKAAGIASVLAGLVLIRIG
jgi:drug/metabolite transporter (DMT)-like permease